MVGICEYRLNLWQNEGPGLSNSMQPIAKADLTKAKWFSIRDQENNPKMQDNTSLGFAIITFIMY